MDWTTILILINSFLTALVLMLLKYNLKSRNDQFERIFAGMAEVHKRIDDHIDFHMEHP